MKLKLILFVFIFQTFQNFVFSDEFPCGNNGLVDTDFIAGATNDPESNPVGHWPWMASIGHYDDNNNWNHECGATLITDRHFLTAAHCVMQEWKIRIGDDNHGSVADDKNAKDLNILASFIHPTYNGVAAYFDVAVLETEPLNFSKSIRPVCLPSAPSADIHKYDNDFMDLIGWGKKGTSGNVSKRLKRISVKIFPQKYCNTTHTRTTVSTEERIKQKLPQLFQNHILCAGTSIGNQGSCNGDSGGPLNFYDSETFSWTQIGIVQGGIRDCGDPDYPGLYIRLDDAEVLNFIFEKTGRETETQKGLKFLSSKNIRIINFRHQEELITTADGPKFNEEGRHIFTDRTKEQIKTNNENCWILEKVSGSIDNVYRIKSIASGEYIYATDLFFDSPRRRVLTWTEKSTSPSIDSDSLRKQADWALEKVDNGYLIKNMRYEEYFYAAAEDRAFDENRRSIFTWQDLETLGPEGIWEFSDIFIQATDYFHLESDIRITTQFLAPAKIECQTGQALISFRLEEKDGNEFHYIYQCKQLKSPVTIRTVEHYWTPWGHESLPEGVSEGSINFLDQQNVKCKTNEYLTSFQLQVNAEQSTIRYVYDCGLPEVQGSCVDRETEEHYAPGYTILGLDGINVGCEENEVLSAFQMKSPPPFKLKYSYSCCNVN